LPGTIRSSGSLAAKCLRNMRGFRRLRLDPSAQLKITPMTMTTISRLRIFHATLATLVLLAYFTGDDDPLHRWLGYGVALLVLIRLIWGLTESPQLGLMKFYPHFTGLRLTNAMTHPAISRTLLLCIALSVILTAGTGIAMDGGRTLGFGAAPTPELHVRVMTRKDDQVERRREHSERRPEWLEDTHELSGNLVLISVALHVIYLFLFKRPLALFMLFMNKPTTRKRAPGD